MSGVKVNWSSIFLKNTKLVTNSLMKRVVETVSLLKLSFNIIQKQKDFKVREGLVAAKTGIQKLN